MTDKVGEIVKYKNEDWKIVADDTKCEQLKKEWDYILKNVNTKETRKIFKKDLTQNDEFEQHKEEAVQQ